MTEDGSEKVVGHEDLEHDREGTGSRLSAPRSGPQAPKLLCEICQEQSPKYTCPGCSRKTCSLECVNRHKVEFSCTGKRDRTAFIKRGNLSYDTLRSDYKFLEEIERVEDVSKRTQPPAPRRQIPKPLKTLVQQAKNRGVSLQLISPGMKRRKENSTRYDFKKKLMFWRVHWVFSDGQEATTSRMSEEANIGEVLDDVLQAVYKNDKDSGRAETSGEEPPVSVAHKVRMRQEGVRADQAIDYDVDVAMTLGEFLRGKHVVEFPTFRVDV